VASPAVKSAAAAVTFLVIMALNPSSVSDDQVFEIIQVAAFYHQVAFMVNSFAITLEKSAARFAVSEVNGCDYYLTVHSFTAKHMVERTSPSRSP
jgi:alkylhydroperoxidase family enzyme